MTTKHIGYSNPRNFKEKIELLKMKEAASTANFAAAMRDAQEICKIAHAYDALPLSIDHSHVPGNTPNRSGILKAYSLSNISNADYQTKKTSDNSNKDTSFLQKSMTIDRKDIHGSGVSNSHTGVYPLASNIHDERVAQRLLLPSSSNSNIPMKETIPVKLDEELLQKSQIPNVCPFLYDPVGSTTVTTTTPDTTSHHLHERNTFVHDTGYTLSNNYLSSSWSTIPPTQHPVPKSCLDNWNDDCSNVPVVVSQHQIQKNFNLFTNTESPLQHYQNLQSKSHITTNPYLFSTSYSNVKLASTTSLLTQQSSLTNSSQYTYESGYFSVGVGTPIGGFRSFPPTNSLQHQLKTPFSANITEQISRAQTPYSVVDWRRTASDSSIHHTLTADHQFHPIEQYAYDNGKSDKSHVSFNAKLIHQSNDAYFRSTCCKQLRGVAEEEEHHVNNNSNNLTSMNDTDHKRVCQTRRHPDIQYVSDNSSSNNNNNNHFMHTELPTHELHIMPAKRPYTCSTELQSSNGLDTTVCQMKMCTSHMDNISGGTMDKTNIDSIIDDDTSLKHHKSWKIHSSVYNNPHGLEQSVNNKSIYPYVSSNSTTNTITTDSKYSKHVNPSLHNIHFNQNNYSFDNNSSNSSSTHLNNLPLHQTESHRPGFVNRLSVSERVISSSSGTTSGVVAVGGGGSSGSIQDGTTRNDVFLRNTNTNNNDLDEYLQLPNLICKADESNSHFAGRRDSCTMTAEILSTLASFRDEIGECSDGKIHSDITTATTTTTTTITAASAIVPVGSGLGSHCANISNRPGVYTTHLLKDDTSAHKNIIKQTTTHIHNSMLSSDSSMPCTNTTSTSTFASSSNSSTTTNTTTTPTTIDQCRLQSTPFVQTHHHHHHHHPHHHHLGAGNSGLCTNSSVPTVYSSCLHHVGDKIGISMSPNDYRLLTDPRLINYVTDKETEAKLINQ